MPHSSKTTSGSPPKANDMREQQHKKMDVLGIPVSVVNMPTAVEMVSGWAQQKLVKLVFLRDIHGLMRAVESEEFRALHVKADLVMPDGMPLTWVGRLRGYGAQIGRTPGADVVEEVCRASVRLGQSHYFFGGKPGVAEKMAANLTAKYPGLRVAGIYSPPMRDIDLDTPLTEQEVAEIDAINDSGADYVWVGISTPKQEMWMAKASPLLARGVLFGVGAAFDFHAGLVKRAPNWMRNSGLEWVHRFASEPRRLWRRYLILAPRFVILMIKGHAK